MRSHRLSQRGISLTGLLFAGVLVGLVAILGMKIWPHVTEYYKVKQTLKAIVKDGSMSSASVSEIRGAFDRRAETNYIDTIKGADIDVTKENGNLVLSIEYSRRVPLFGPASLVFDFQASSNQ